MVKVIYRSSFSGLILSEKADSLKHAQYIADNLLSGEFRAIISDKITVLTKKAFDNGVHLA